MGVCMKDLEVCEEHVIHPEIIKQVKENLPEHETLDALADLFKVFGDYTRIKLLCALFGHEMCVCDLAEVTQMSQSAISHQLRVLKQAQLVGNRRQGKTIFYFLKDEHVKLIYEAGLSHVKEKI